MASSIDLPDLDRLGRAPRLALVYAPPACRDMVAALLILDEQFAGFVRNASEPVLGQMRLAWWRDRFSQDPSQWPRGNPLLAKFAEFGSATQNLSKVVDAWEDLLGERPLDRGRIVAHAQGRARAWHALAESLDLSAEADRAADAATRWALVDFAWGMADEGERALALDAARTMGSRPQLPRPLRSIGVLAALAERAAAKDRAPLSRASDVTIALRAGLLRR